MRTLARTGKCDKCATVHDTSAAFHEQHRRASADIQQTTTPRRSSLTLSSKLDTHQKKSGSHNKKKTETSTHQTMSLFCTNCREPGGFEWRRRMGCEPCCGHRRRRHRDCGCRHERRNRHGSERSDDERSDDERSEVDRRERRRRHGSERRHRDRDARFCGGCTTCWDIGTNQ